MTKIVIDVGSYPHGAADSIEILREAYQPVMIFGFDPLYNELEVGKFRHGRTEVVLSPNAAWTCTGHLGLHRQGSSTRVVEGGVGIVCFDLAAFIKRFSPASKVVLKIDAEGAEYALLPHLKSTGADRRLELILVEWHDGPRDYELACPVELWEH